MTTLRCVNCGDEHHYVERVSDGVRLVCPECGENGAKVVDREESFEDFYE